MRSFQAFSAAALATAGFSPASTTGNSALLTLGAAAGAAAGPTLAPGQTLGAGSGRFFAAQTSGTGTPHPTAGDTWTVTYTTGGQSFTQNGTF